MWLTTSLILIAAAQAVHNSDMACIANNCEERYDYQCSLFDMYESLKSKHEDDQELNIFGI